MTKTIRHMVRREIPLQNRAIGIHVTLIIIEEPYFKVGSAKKMWEKTLLRDNTKPQKLPEDFLDKALFNFL